MGSVCVGGGGGGGRGGASCLVEGGWGGGGGGEGQDTLLHLPYKRMEYRYLTYGFNRM